MVIHINKRLLAVVSACLTLFVMAVIGLTTALPASADPCDGAEVKVIIAGQGVNACVPLASLPTITITLPQVTVTTTLPRLPRATITKTRVVNAKKLPAVTNTATLVRRVPVRVPVRVPGPVTTRTVNRFVELPRQTVTTTATIAAPTVTSTVTVVKTATPEKEVVTITKTKAVGISLLLVLIGVLIALALMRMAYAYGWIKGDSGNRRFIREIIDGLRFKD